MADVWSNVVYTTKTEFKGPLSNQPEVPKTELWEMPDTPPQAPAPEPETIQWEIPDLEPPVDTTVVSGGTKLEEAAQAPDDENWFEKVLDFLDSLPKAQPEPEQPPQVEPPKTEAPKVEPKKEESKPIPAEGRTFKTQGDPLIKTGDGLWFGVHEPGKYVSLKSTSGDFMMEQEISKTRDGRKYNTGMGFKLDGNTIAFSTNGGNGPNTMTVNGKTYDLKFAAHGIDLPGGGKVTYDPKTSKVHLSSADGDQITVHRVNNKAGVHYLNAEVTLSEKRPSDSVFGLLGNLDADTDAANDTKGRDGKPMAVNGTTKLDMNDGRLWKTPEDFAKEWRTRAGEGVL